MILNPWVKTIATSVLIFAALASFKIFQIQQGIAFAESFPEHSESVESGFSRLMPYTKSLTVLGDVISPQQVALYSETPGRIVEVGFTSGEKVQQGQVLIQQDISEERALLDAAEAQRDLAASIYRRNKNLYASNAVSEEQFDRARADLATIEAEIARLNSVIRKKTITAPFAGKAGIHQFEAGLFLLDNVFITQLISEQDHLWIDFYVPQFYPVLPVGANVEVKLLRDAVNNIDSAWVSAEILARSMQVDLQNRSYQYRDKVDVAAFPVGINSGVSVRIPVTDTVDTVAVPATAIQHDHLGQFVYLLEDDEPTGSYRAVRRAVKVLDKQQQWVFIREGLTENQLVASDGAFKLYPGLLVHSKPTARPGRIDTAMSITGDGEAQL